MTVVAGFVVEEKYTMPAESLGVMSHFPYGNGARGIPPLAIRSSTTDK